MSNHLCVNCVDGLCVCAADKIVRTLGEGTFGKVVECLDLSRSVAVCVCVSVCVCVTDEFGDGSLLRLHR